MQEDKEVADMVERQVAHLLLEQQILVAEVVADQLTMQEPVEVLAL